MEPTHPHDPATGDARRGDAGPGAARSGGPGWLLLLACFFLSGAAGLIYQTAWSQRFAQVFGASELAVATVLAAYMAGLAVGAAAAGRLEGRVRRPVLVYGLLELGIAAGALLVPWGLHLAGRLQVALLGGRDLPPDAGSPTSALFYLAAAFLVLLVPTGLMGATLPLLARHAVRRDEQIASRIGVLYTANTTGAAAGTLGAAFVLLPRLGLDRTVLVAAGVNAAVFLCAAALARLLGDRRAASAPAPHPIAATPAAGRWVLPLILISGAVSFTYEVTWTRLLSHLLGGSVYAFGTMLATFLVGLSLGAAVAARLGGSRERARRGFAAAQVAIAALSLAAFAVADRLPAVVAAVAGSGTLLAGSALGALTLLPGAVAIGATFPLAVRILAHRAEEAPRASARVFAWNTVGAIAGSVAAGFAVLPALRYAGTVTAAAAVSLVLAAVAATAERPRLRGTAAAAVTAIAAVVLLRPSTPWALLRHSPIAGAADTAGLDGAEAGDPAGAAGAAADADFYAVGRTADVLLVDRGDGWRLTTNGLPEALIQPPGARVGELAVARWLSLLPLLGHPEARSLLVVGLGGSVALEETPPGFDDVHVVELEPEVIRANRAVAGERRADPLADPRLHLHADDARSALLLGRRRFDAVVSQPSHPWTAGASHLFTREFFTLVRDRLSDDGVFVQWIGLTFVDEELLRSLVATLAEVFPRVEVYLVQRAALFLAGPATLDTGATAAAGIAAAPESWRRVGVRSPGDALYHRLLDDAGARKLAAGAPLNRDGHNRLQTRSPRVLGAFRRPGAVDAFFAPHDPLLASSGEGLDRFQMARRAVRYGAADRARRLAATVPDPALRETARALVDAGAGRRREAERRLRAAREIDPEAEEPLLALLQLYRREIRRGEELLLLRELEDAPARAVVEGWRLEGRGDPSAVRRLEPELAAVPPGHLLADDALRLRVGWRLATGDPARGGEALELVEDLLAGNPLPGDLLLRTEAALAAGDPAAAVASLHELARGLGQGRFPASVLRPALALAGALPEGPAAEAVRSRLRPGAR
jgi:spermidine synthase